MLGIRENQAQKRQLRQCHSETQAEAGQEDGVEIQAHR